MTMPADMPASPGTWVIAAITGLTTVLGIFIVQIFGLIGQRDAAKHQREAAARAEEMIEQARVAAIRAEEVRVTLQYSTKDTEQRLREINAKTDVIRSTTDQVHTLVNSRLGAVLTRMAETARMLADITKDPRHDLMAKDAENAASEHERQNEAVEHDEQGK